MLLILFSQYLLPNCFYSRGARRWTFLAATYALLFATSFWTGYYSSEVTPSSPHYRRGDDVLAREIVMTTARMMQQQQQPLLQHDEVALGESWVQLLMMGTSSSAATSRNKPRHQRVHREHDLSLDWKSYPNGSSSLLDKDLLLPMVAASPEERRNVAPTRGHVVLPALQPPSSSPPSSAHSSTRQQRHRTMVVVHPALVQPQQLV